MAETGKVVDEIRDPWYHRWGGFFGEWRRRYRGLDDRQQRQVGIILRVAIVILLFFIGWPVALLVAALFTAQFAVGYLPRPYRKYGRFAIPLILLVVVLTYPFYLGNLGTMGLLGDYPTLGTMTIMGVYSMMAVGLNIVVGYAGLLDLGYVAFYAMGAYTCAWFASVQFANHKVHLGDVGVASTTPGIHISIWLLVAIAGILTAVIGMLIGLPALPLRGDYLAIVTLGFGEILPQVANNGDNLGGFNLTNGPNGITPVDAPGIFGTSFQTGSGAFFT